MNLTMIVEILLYRVKRDLCSSTDFVRPKNIFAQLEISGLKFTISPCDAKVELEL